MTIMTARRYSKGLAHPEPLEIDGTPRVRLASGQFDWIGVANPEGHELDRLRTQFDLHPLAIEDALNANQLPKVESYGDKLFIIARTAEAGEGDEMCYGETALFLAPDFVISVRHGSGRDHAELRRQLEMRPDRLIEGPDFVAHSILDFIVDGYTPIIEALENTVRAMEERAIETFPAPATIRRIFRLRAELRRFERVVGPMEGVCTKLVTDNLPAVDPTARPWFRDVLDHVHRVLGRVDALRETLHTMVETAALLEQHRQGDMTRQLAAWAAILAVPTAVAGIYGMNFQFMPELHWRYGYFLVLGFIALVCATLYFRFRKIGWL